jgi:hypothetical protein
VNTGVSAVDGVFAIRTASRSSSAAITLSTGPKISSLPIVELLSTLPKTVGST